MKLTQTPENQLLAILEKQSALVNELSALLEKEKIALQELDIAAIEQTAADKNQLTAAITTAGATAIETARALGFSADEHGYEECVDSFSAQHETIARYRSALAENSRKCLELNRQNGLLISSGAHLANDMMNVLRGQNSEAVAVYDANGRSASTRPATTELGSA